MHDDQQDARGEGDRRQRRQQLGAGELVHGDVRGVEQGRPEQHGREPEQQPERGGERAPRRRSASGRPPVARGRRILYVHGDAEGGRRRVVVRAAQIRGLPRPVRPVLLGVLGRRLPRAARRPSAPRSCRTRPPPRAPGAAAGPAGSGRGSRPDSTARSPGAETAAISVIDSSIASSESGIVLVSANGRMAGPFDEIIAATGFRPDFSFLREMRLDLDPWVESTRALAPLIDPNVHSCGSVPPHGAAELAHPEHGFYAIGAKSYGRAPNLLLATGYEQARSVVAELAGDHDAAARVELVLPAPGRPAASRASRTEAPEPELATSACCG